MLWYLPLEHLDQRYTTLMDEQVVRTLRRRGIEYRRIYGEPLSATIDTGAFLDAASTSHFKATQLATMAQAFRDGEVKDGDKFLVSDLWFPGIESIPYMAYFHKVKVDVWGIAHAGSWTETDFVRDMREWARPIEVGWFEFAKGVFVGSWWHRHELCAIRNRCAASKVHVTGLAFSTKDIWKLIGPLPPKRDLVVMAGRLDDEKQPWHFDEIAERIGGDVEFVKTYERRLDKVSYLRLLAEAKVIFSAALQENFGYAVLEAATVGATPVVPDRLAYREMYPAECRYGDLDEAEQLVRRYLAEPLDVSHVPARFDGSVGRMLDAMGLRR